MARFGAYRAAPVILYKGSGSRGAGPRGRPGAAMRFVGGGPGVVVV